MSINPSDPSLVNIPTTKEISIPKEPDNISTLRWIGRVALGGTADSIKLATWAIANPLSAATTLASVGGDYISSGYNYLAGKNIEPLVLPKNEEHPPSSDESSSKTTHLKDEAIVAHEESLPEGAQINAPPSMASNTQLQQTSSAIPESKQGGFLNSLASAVVSVASASINRVEVLGYNINPINATLGVVSSIGSLISSSEPIMSDEQLISDIKKVQKSAQESLPIQVKPISEIEKSRTNQIETQKIAEFKAQVDTETNTLARELTDFSAITILESAIFSNSPKEGFLSLYKEYKTGSDPKQEYLNKLYEKSTFKWLIAKITIPIISKIIGGILNPPEGSEGGIKNLISKLKNYFSSPENSKKEIIGFLKSATDYLNKLKELNTIYNNHQQAPEDISLTREEYIKKHIGRANLEPAFEKFNAFVSNTVAYKSNIFLIGPAIDFLVNYSIKKTITAINPIGIALEKISRNDESSDNLNYNIADSLRKNLLTINESLKTQTTNEPQNSLKSSKPVRVNTPKAVEALNSDQKSIVEGFLKAFLNYLPLEGVKDDELNESLKTNILGEDQGGVIDKTLASTLKNKIEELILDLSGQILKTQENKGLGYRLLSENLKKINQIFSPETSLSQTEPTVVHTKAECLEVTKETKTLLRDLISNVLEKELQKSPMEKTQIATDEQTNIILLNHRSTVENFSKIIAEFNESFKAIDSIEEAEALDLKLNSLLADIEHHANLIYEDVDDALKFSSLNSKIKDQIKQTTAIQIRNLQQTIDAIKELKVQTQQIEKPLIERTELDFLKLTENTQSDFNHILPGLQQERLEEIFTNLGPLLTDSQQIKLSECKEHVETLSKTNESLKKREQVQDLFQTMLQGFNHIQQLNQQILARPQGANLLSLKKRIEEIERINNGLLRSQTIEIAQDNIESLNQEIDLLQKDISSFSKIMPVDQRILLEDSINTLQSFLTETKKVTDLKALKDIIKHNWQNFSSALKTLKTTLENGNKYSLKDKTTINALIKQLSDNYEKTALYVADKLQDDDFKDVKKSFDVITDKLLETSRQNQSTDQKSRETLDFKSFMANLAESDATNLVQFGTLINTKIFQEEALLTKLDSIRTENDQELRSINTKIQGSKNTISELASSSIQEEEKLKGFEQPIRFYLGAGPAIKYLAKDAIENKLAKLTDKVIDFTLDPSHREGLLVWGPLSRIPET